jgi:hypothetical protein
MKNIILMIILSILSEIFIFPQFKIKETIEVKVNYENEFIQKPLKILIVSEDDDNRKLACPQILTTAFRDRGVFETEQSISLPVEKIHYLC